MLILYTYTSYPRKKLEKIILESMKGHRQDGNYPGYRNTGCWWKEVTIRLLLKTKHDEVTAVVSNVFQL